MSLTKIIETFRPHKSNYEAAMIQLDSRGNIYGINQLAGDQTSTVLGVLGIQFKKEDIIGDGNYPINFVNYLKTTDIHSISEKARHQLAQHIEDLISGKMHYFEIDPAKNGNKNGADEQEFHFHFKGSQDKVSDNYTIVIADQTGVTHFKRLYEQANKQLERLANMGQAIAEILHEIKNPLYVMGGYSDSLRKKLVDEKYRKFADIIFQENSRLFGIIVNSLDYIKEPKMEKVDVDLSSLAKEIYEKQGYDIIYQPKISMDLNKGVVARGDHDRLYQVFLNLISNAIEEDGVDSVVIRTYQKERFSIFEVEDDGKEGMSEDVRKNLFKPFFTTKQQGTGLGLAHSGKLIDYHGGEIKVESKPGNTVFSVYLPLKKQ